MNSETSRNDVPATTHSRCPHCGALRAVSKSSCWLCGATLPSIEPTEASAIDSSPSPPASPTADKFSFSISTLLLATTLVAVCAALVAELPSLGIPICILLAPVLVRTIMVVRRRETAGKHVSMGEKVGLILTSFVVINVILAVVGVAAVGSFCAVCLGTVGALNQAAMPVAVLAAACVTIPLLVLMFRWVRARYQRDIS